MVAIFLTLHVLESILHSNDVEESNDFKTCSVWQNTPNFETVWGGIYSLGYAYNTVAFIHNEFNFI